MGPRLQVGPLRLGPHLGLGPRLGPSVGFGPQLGPPLGLGPRPGVALLRLGPRQGLALGLGPRQGPTLRRGLGLGPAPGLGPRLGPSLRLGPGLGLAPGLGPRLGPPLGVGPLLGPHCRGVDRPLVCSPAPLTWTRMYLRVGEGLQGRRAAPRRPPQRRTPFASQCATHSRPDCAKCSSLGHP